MSKNRVPVPPLDGKYSRVPPGWQPPPLRHDSHGGNFMEDFFFPLVVLVGVPVLIIVVMWVLL